MNIAYGFVGDFLLYAVGYSSMTAVILVHYFFLQSQLDMEERCTAIVDTVLRLNFTLMSFFNCAIICPVSLVSFVRDVFNRKGASLTQQGFVHHKQKSSTKQGDKAFTLFASLNERQAYLFL